MVEAGLEDITLKAARRNGYGGVLQKSDMTAEQNTSFSKDTHTDSQATMNSKPGSAAKKSPVSRPRNLGVGRGEASTSRVKSDVKIVIGDDMDYDDTSIASLDGSMSTNPSADDEASSYASRVSLKLVSVVCFVYVMFLPPNADICVRFTNVYVVFNEHVSY